MGLCQVSRCHRSPCMRRLGTVLNRDDAMRLVFDDISAWGAPVAVSGIWGDDRTFVVFVEAAGISTGRPDHGIPMIVERSDGHVERAASPEAARRLLEGISRIPWQPYRPVDPNISSTRIRTCRRCGGKLVPVIWGLPGPDLFEESAQGTVALGGCVLPAPGEPHPAKACRDCGWELIVEPNRPSDSPLV